jgi:hypothetical protein
MYSPVMARLLGEAYIPLLPETDDFARAHNARLRQGMASSHFEGDWVVITSDEAALNDTEEAPQPVADDDLEGQGP